MNLPRIVVTPGEPAGIGPDIVVQLAQKKFPAELIVVADPDVMHACAKQLNLPFNLEIIPVKLKHPVTAGKLNAENAEYVLRTLVTATSLCKEKKADALVTGPVNKEIMNTAGISFSGHTEFLAQQCGVPKTIMLFVVDQLKVALATTHLPLADVPRAITHDLLKNTLLLLHKELQQKFNISSPRILVCGLNPHAGEGGYLGREEIEIIEPVITELVKQNLNVKGPLPADTIFTPKLLQEADAILAMYHDQALPVIKYAGFDRAVNVTLGLPFIRTSVDHGTALDLAGTGKANASSLEAAVRLAIMLAR